MTLIAVLISSIAGVLAMHPGASHQTDCFAQLARCGYPTAGTTGVPPGPKLQPSGSITVTKNGTTLNRLRVTGTIDIQASDVTISESMIRAPKGGSGTAAIVLEEGADDFTIESSEVSGPEKPGDAIESAVWNHYGNPGASAARSYFHNCADCWEGPGRFRGDYIIVNSDYPGSHNEDIYVCGGSVAVEQSTLINRFEQTATVFGDTSGCGGNRMKIVGSMLAGGGYVLYPQASAETSVGSMYIVGNRFARCATKPVFDETSGGTACAGGPDQAGVFPHGGYFGFAAYYSTGAGQIWRENVWDDDLRPVCIQHSC
jgi:hypothetical protein